MIGPNKNPLTIPASLATDGIQGAEAKTLGPCEVKDTPEGRTARTLALIATDTARAQLARYALLTDWPALGVVEAADLLDSARAMLADRGAP